MLRHIDLTRIAQICLLFALLLGGCTVHPPKINQGALEGSEKGRAARLESLLAGLNEKVDAKEAKLLAHDSISYAYTLSQRYDLVWPPLFHNTLVNVGIKERGLCHQWADDMFAHLSGAKYESFDFYLGVANLGKYNEHNALVVSAKGMSFSEGVLLDAWRDSGTLFFVKVGEDSEYSWEHRSD